MSEESNPKRVAIIPHYHISVISQMVNCPILIAESGGQARTFFRSRMDLIKDVTGAKALGVGVSCIQFDNDDRVNLWECTCEDCTIDEISGQWLVTPFEEEEK